MLKNVSKQLGLIEHYPIIWKDDKEQIAVFIHTTNKPIINDYVVKMHPFNVKELALWSARKIGDRNEYILIPKDRRERMLKSSIIHIAYKTIYTKPLETRPYSSSGMYFANEWKEPWGKVMKWEEKSVGAKYEFFLSNVSSQSELKDRLEQLFAWVDKNNLQPIEKFKS